MNGWHRALKRALAGVLLGLAALAAPAQWTGVPRVVAFADVHGAYAELTTLLRETGVIDAELRWAAGRTHLVSLGDLLDRGADSRRVMDLLMRLQGEAEAAGGRVHVVLGNHEAMNLLGDLRYVHPGEYAAYADMEATAEREAQRRAWLAANPGAEAGAFERKFPPGYFGHRAAFAAQGHYGRWLLTLPVAVTINDSLFMHAGPSQQLLGMGLAELNLRYRSALVESLGAADRPLQVRVEAARNNPLLSVDGPNWYRGAALCREAVEADVLLPLLQQWGATRLVVGHTVAPGGRATTRFDGRVVKLDAGMNRAAYQGRAVALVLQPRSASVLYAGEPGARPLTPEPLFVAPADVDDAQVQAALNAGEVSITGPRAPNELDVTVAHRGERIPAVFRVRPAAEVQHELAAHRLDRLLGLGLVPATAAREVQGQAGVLQARPAQWQTQAELPGQASRRRGGWCDLPRQMQLVQAFDALLGLAPRSAEQLLLDTQNWTVFTTAHEHAFGTTPRPPAAAAPLVVGAELRRRLNRLSPQSLASALGAMLDDTRRAALLARRDALLALPLPAAVSR